jgi:MoxR-like ATPase
MQERQVTAGGRRHALPSPFFVLATQNPIEQEGTYPLPEAQLDRFMFEVKIGYPTEEEEFEIVRRTTRGPAEPVQRVLTSGEIHAAQNAVRSIPIPDHVVRYAMRFARLTRRDDPQAPDFIRKYVSWGAGPRASQFLVLAAKARAMLHGRLHVAEDDVQAVAKPVLRHRIVTNFDAEADGLTPDHIVDRLTETIPVGPDRTPGWVAGLMTK